MKVVVTVVFVCLLLILALVFFMRKDFPYDIEVVPQDNGFLIYNTTTWADRDCSVVVKGMGKNYKKNLLAKKGYLFIDGLENEQQYKVIVGRSDFFGLIKYSKFETYASPRKLKNYVVLFGASVGKSWNLRSLSKRKNGNANFFGYRGKYEFDKEELLSRVIKSPVKPDYVIIKECAAYFPRDVEKGFSKINLWLESLRNSGINPIVATVVPITKKRAEDEGERIKSINKFNNKLRFLGKQNGILVFDLQKLLSDGSEEMYLDEKYAREDGLHLNKMAYEYLDDSILEFFKKIDINK